MPDYATVALPTTRRAMKILQRTFRGRVTLVGVFDNRSNAVDAAHQHYGGEIIFEDDETCGTAPPYDGWADNYLILPVELNVMIE